jgi:hypothetical protein
MAAGRTGDVLRLADGSSATLHGSEDVSPSASLVAPATPTDGLVAYDVELCAGLVPASVDPDRLTLVLADRSRLVRSPPAIDPPLLAARLIAGSCERGWVTFEEPNGSVPAYLDLVQPDGVGATWTLP